MDEQNRSSQGVAGAFLGTRLTLRTRTQERWQRYTASDEVMQIRQTVQVETLGLTEGQVRRWARYLQDLLKNGGQEAEVHATREILARSVLPVTTVVAFRNHWRFSTPGAAFAAMWVESEQAVTRFNPAAGRLRFAAFMESTLSMRAQAVAEDAEGGERKLLERLGSLRSWITQLGMTESVSAQELFAGIQAQLSAEEFGHQYFTTPRRVENALEALRVRGAGNLLSLDFRGDDEDGTGSLLDTVTVDPEAAERSRLLAEVGPVLSQLEQAGLLDGVLALPEGVLNELLELAARMQGDSWLPAIAVVMGLDPGFVREVVRTVLPFFRSAA